MYPTAGQGGSGQVTAYTLAQAQTSRLVSISFQVVTGGAAGTHAVRVKITMPDGSLVGPFDDLNAGGPGQTNFYTFGQGLNASACTITTGMAVTDALPPLELPPGTQIVLQAIDAAGNTIAGDTFSAVVLMLDDQASVTAFDSNEPISLLPSAAAA